MKFFDKVRAFANTHAGQQLGRFIRLAVVSGATIFFASGGQLSWGALGGAAVGGIEAAYRQFQQTQPVQEASDPEPSDTPASQG